MNERIEKLAEQAGIVFWEMSGDVDWRQANTETLEKFAELIVQECVELFPERHYYYSGSAIKRNIKKHFGVEE